MTFLFTGSSPVDFEAFPRQCKRSRLGSVRLLPGKTVSVTPDEAHFLLSAGLPLSLVQTTFPRRPAIVTFTVPATAVSERVESPPVVEPPPQVEEGAGDDAATAPRSRKRTKP